MAGELLAIETAAARADTLWRAENLAAAGAAYAEASERTDALPDAQRSPSLRLRQLQWLGALAQCRRDLGAFGEAERLLGNALSRLTSLREIVPAAAWHEVSVLLRSALASVWLYLGRPAEARAALVELLPQAGGRQRLQLLLRLGAADSMLGDVEPAIAWHVQAIAQLEAVDLADEARARGAAWLNLGTSYWKAGRHAEALDAIGRARAVFAGMMAGGRAARRHDLARALMNEGGVRISIGDPIGAVEAYDAALNIYDALRASARDAGTRMMLRVSRARTQMNRGYALLRAGEGEAALQALRSAERAGRRLPGCADDLARTRVNLAHVWTSRGEHDRARRLYAAGCSVLATSAAGGHNPQLQADHANAALHLAHASWQRGRIQASCAGFAAACTTLARLTREGQLQHATRWLDGVLDQADLALRQPPRRQQLRRLWAATLSSVLADAPRRSVVGLVFRIGELAQAAARIALWPEGSAERVGLLRQLLDALALLLGEADPGELTGCNDVLASLTEQLGSLARAETRTPALVVDWFLRTRGLRAQRSAIAEAGGEAFAQLRALLADLRRIEEDLLGRAPAGSGNGPRGGRGAAPADAAPATPPARLARWRAVREAYDAQRDALLREGLLPPAMRLDAQAVAARLGPRQALVLLARHGHDEILVACVRQARIVVQARKLRGDAARWRVDTLNAALRERLAAHGARGLRRGPRVAVTGDEAALARMPFSMASEHALSLLRDLFDQTLRPAAEQALADGVDEVAVVPSGDLHLLPLVDLLEPLLPQPIRFGVLPSAGAWAMPRAAPATRPRWALLAWAALPGPRELPWVLLEREASLALWRGRGRTELLEPEHPRADHVDALLGIGHSCLPGDNLARAGLLIGPRRVLTAHDAARIRRAELALMSCCVLGHVGDAHGEPLGFLATSFAYGTRMGVGWLIDVPDAEACLFSLALQHAWRAAEAAHQTIGVGGSSKAGRHEVFRIVRRGIQNGVWPEGFGAWLADALPAAAASAALAPGPWRNRYEVLRDFDGGFALAPPPSLRALMPWVTALGH